ncbi:MAG: hypothetical protein MHMPM18_000564 [Marteilia pararefringens]
MNKTANGGNNFEANEGNAKTIENEKLNAKLSTSNEYSKSGANLSSEKICEKSAIENKIIDEINEIYVHEGIYNGNRRKLLQALAQNTMEKDSKYLEILQSIDLLIQLEQNCAINRESNRSFKSLNEVVWRENIDTNRSNWKIILQTPNGEQIIIVEESTIIDSDILALVFALASHFCQINENLKVFKVESIFYSITGWSHCQKGLSLDAFLSEFICSDQKKSTEPVDVLKSYSKNCPLIFKELLDDFGTKYEYLILDRSEVENELDCEKVISERKEKPGDNFKAFRSQKKLQFSSRTSESNIFLLRILNIKPCKLLFSIESANSFTIETSAIVKESKVNYFPSSPEGSTEFEEKYQYKTEQNSFGQIFFQFFYSGLNLIVFRIQRNNNISETPVVCDDVLKISADHEFELHEFESSQNFPEQQFDSKWIKNECDRLFVQMQLDCLKNLPASLSSYTFVDFTILLKEIRERLENNFGITISQQNISKVLDLQSCEINGEAGTNNSNKICSSILKHHIHPLTLIEDHLAEKSHQYSKFCKSQFKDIVFLQLLISRNIFKYKIRSYCALVRNSKNRFQNDDLGINTNHVVGNDVDAIVKASNIQIKSCSYSTPENFDEGFRLISNIGIIKSENEVEHKFSTVKILFPDFERLHQQLFIVLVSVTNPCKLIMVKSSSTVLNLNTNETIRNILILSKYRNQMQESNTNVIKNSIIIISDKKNLDFDPEAPQNNFVMNSKIYQLIDINSRQSFQKYRIEKIPEDCSFYLMICKNNNSSSEFYIEASFDNSKILLESFEDVPGFYISGNLWAKKIEKASDSGHNTIHLNFKFKSIDNYSGFLSKEEEDECRKVFELIFCSENSIQKLGNAEVPSFYAIENHFNSTESGAVDSTNSKTENNKIKKNAGINQPSKVAHSTSDEKNIWITKKFSEIKKSKPSFEVYLFSHKNSNEKFIDNDGQMIQIIKDMKMSEDIREFKQKNMIFMDYAEENTVEDYCKIPNSNLAISKIIDCDRKSNRCMNFCFNDYQIFNWIKKSQKMIDNIQKNEN